jgi:hypothetical protein
MQLVGAKFNVSIKCLNDPADDIKEHRLLESLSTQIPLLCATREPPLTIVIALKDQCILFNGQVDTQRRRFSAEYVSSILR